MKTFRSISIVVAVAVVAFIVGSRWAERPPGEASDHHKVLYYACPMHPQYRSDRPGDCPSCGMRLEPVYADRAAPPLPALDGSQPPAGAVHVSPERQQTIGVRLGVVERLSGTRTLRTTGRVAPNENATYPLVSGVQALVREVRSAAAGNTVRKDEVLATLYAPEYVITAQSFLAALTNAERLGVPDPNQIAAAKTNVQRAGDSLRNLGVSEGQIEELRTTRKVTPHIAVASPVDGYVLQRSILVGQRVEAGTELYRVADLRRVWIFADVYETQQRFIRAGLKAQVVAAQLDRQYTATVTSAQPLFDETTRTLRVRLETDNPGMALLPGMFVDVEFAIDVPPALAVPADAIVDSGLRKTVFVERANGYFDPRTVTTGWRIGDQVEITKGLMAGDRIVIAGTFLMDSESRMKAAAAGNVAESVTDAVCGMDVDPKKATVAGKTALHDGKTYYFCSDECRTKFEKAPKLYIK
jgi:membrane fusion protein, copper/silver efflux system